MNPYQDIIDSLANNYLWIEFWSYKIDAYNLVTWICVGTLLMLAVWLVRFALKGE